MRRVLGAGAVGLTGALLAGCGVPQGTDGKLVDDWAAPPAAVMWSPKAGDCLITSGDTIPLAVYRPVPCTKDHLAETVSVSAFTGAMAQRDTVPAEGSPERRAAYVDCVTKTTEFLGDDYRAGALDLRVGLPSGAAWSGGARWYRCDLVEIKDDENATEVRRTSSLKGGLAAGGPLRRDCFTITEKADKKHVDTALVACTASHNGEYAGLYLAPDVPAPDDAAAEKMSDNCDTVVAKYAGLPNDRNLSFRVGLVWYWWGEKEWNRGNRAFHCTMWMEKPASKLMKGAGPSAFPVT